jgi:hypothetical protein
MIQAVYPGFRIQGSKGTGSVIRNTASDLYK